MPDSIDHIVNQQIARRRIPGLSLAIIDGGKIVKACGYGSMGGENPTPVTADTLFQAGSVSKSVTALGALNLVESGHLNLDGDINGLLRSWHVPENEFTHTQKVTLRRLLSHRAGATVHGFRGYAPGTEIPTVQQILDGLPPANSSPVRIDCVPGTLTRYSGGGYIIIQQAMLDAMGEDYTTWMKRHVLEPMGMSASTFAQTLPAKLSALAACGHTLLRKPLSDGWRTFPELTAAGLWSTASDLARFAIQVHQMLAGKHVVVSPAMMQEAIKPHNERWGLGFELTGSGRARRFGHSGRNAGFDSNMLGFIETGQGLAIMMNKNEDTPVLRLIMDEVAKTYGWPDWTLHRPARPIEEKEPQIGELLRRVIATTDRSILCGGEFLADSEIREMALIGRQNRGTAPQYRYRLTLDHDSVVASFYFMPPGRIANLIFDPE